MKPAEASMPLETEVRVNGSFDAPATLVRRAYMEPDLLRRWFTGPPNSAMPNRHMHMTVGGQYQWR